MKKLEDQFLQPKQTGALVIRSFTVAHLTISAIVVFNPMNAVYDTPIYIQFRRSTFDRSG